ISYHEYPLSHRVAQAAYGLAFYPLRTLMPRDLSTIYEIPRDFDPLSGPFVLGAVVAITLTVLFFALRRRYPARLAVWLCYVATVAPVLGVAQSGQQIVADRYSYLSCLGFPLLIAGGLLSLRGRPERLAAAVATPIALLFLGLLSWRQTRTWENS